MARSKTVKIVTFVVRLLHGYPLTVGLIGPWLIISFLLQSLTYSFAGSRITDWLQLHEAYTACDLTSIMSCKNRAVGPRVI